MDDVARACRTVVGRNFDEFHANQSHDRELRPRRVNDVPGAKIAPISIRAKLSRYGSSGNMWQWIGDAGNVRDERDATDDADRRVDGRFRPMHCPYHPAANQTFGRRSRN